MTMTSYPLSHGDITPGDGFTKMECGVRMDGLPDGVHTGGPWLSPRGEVWKPLDCKPYANAEFRVPTHEAECLSEMEGMPGFPDNWHIEPSNGRLWLVRPKCYLVPQEADLWSDTLVIEEGVRAMNRAGWEIGDAIQAAIDPDGIVFILDLSTAHHFDNPGHLYCNEWQRINTWFRENKMDRLAELRERGHHLPIEWWIRPPPSLEFQVPDRQEHDKWVHVYASLSRPMSSVWARIPDAIYVDATDNEGHRVHVHTWVVTPQPIAKGTKDRYELTWAWSPIR